MKLFVAAVVLLVALGARVLAQTPEIDALRVRAEQGDPEAQYDIQVMYRDGPGVPQMVRWYRLAADQGRRRAVQTRLHVCKRHRHSPRRWRSQTVVSAGSRLGLGQRTARSRLYVL